MVHSGTAKLGDILFYSDKPEGDNKVARFDSLMDAMEKMVRGEKKALPVVEGGNLVGIITGRDLWGAYYERIDPLDCRVVDIMTKGDLLKATADMAIQKALNLMTGRGVRHLPVIDENDALVGFFSLEGITEGLNVLKEAELDAHKETLSHAN